MATVLYGTIQEAKGDYSTAQTIHQQILQKGSHPKLLYYEILKSLLQKITVVEPNFGTYL